VSRPQASELLEATESGFVAGAMWAARELGQPDSEAAAWQKRAAAAAREGYGPDEEEDDWTLDPQALAAQIRSQSCPGIDETTRDVIANIVARNLASELNGRVQMEWGRPVLTLQPFSNKRGTPRIELTPERGPLNITVIGDAAAGGS
jgi:hypothetical protein